MRVSEWEGNSSVSVCEVWERGCVCRHYRLCWLFQLLEWSAHGLASSQPSVDDEQFNRRKKRIKTFSFSLVNKIVSFSSTFLLSFGRSFVRCYSLFKTICCCSCMLGEASVCFFLKILLNIFFVKLNRLYLVKKVWILLLCLWSFGKLFSLSF